MEDPDEEDKAEASAWLDANADVAAPWFDAPDRGSRGTPELLGANEWHSLA